MLEYRQEICSKQNGAILCEERVKRGKEEEQEEGEEVEEEVEEIGEEKAGVEGKKEEELLKEVEGSAVLSCHEKESLL